MAIGASAQTISLGQFGFTRPKGYMLQDNPQAIFYNKSVGKQYGQLLIYPLEHTAADAAACFKKHWDFFARNAEQGIADPETVEVDSVNGWTYTFGAARGSYKGQMFALTLSSRFREGLTYFVASVISDKQFLEDSQLFFNSVEPLPDTLLAWKQKTNRSQVGPASPPQGLTGEVQTEFEDGWISTYVNPYVVVTRGDLKAWIFPVNDSLDKVGRITDEYVEDRYWRYAVNQFFEVRNVAERPWQMSGPGSDKIFEAEVRNRLTGEESFVAMRVIWNSGRAQVVLAFAPTKDIMYNGVFAQYNSFEQVLPYNHFMVTPALLTGTWQSFETGTTGSYSIAGGFQGGNAKISFTDGFIFNADGTYESKHAVSRNNGTMRRAYEGRYQLNGSTIQLTNRDKEDPGELECWLEAVHGGLALVMVNKKFTGQRFKMFRVK